MDRISSLSEVKQFEYMKMDVWFQSVTAIVTNILVVS